MSRAGLAIMSRPKIWAQAVEGMRTGFQAHELQYESEHRHTCSVVRTSSASF